MSIRIRNVKGILIALCVARSVEQSGDIYLDDAVHHALASQFTEDFTSEGGLMAVNQRESAIRSHEESNNSDREWWDSVYAANDCGVDR